MGEGQISWIVVDDYCDRRKICGEQRDDMHFFIQQMDQAYLDWKAKKAQQDKGA